MQQCDEDDDDGVGLVTANTGNACSQHEVSVCNAYIYIYMNIVSLY